MLNQNLASSTSPSDNRIFVYEISGLKQNQLSDRQKYPIRKSGNVFLKVPYRRMNEEMLRINRLGGEIVSIKSLEDFNKDNTESGDQE